MSTSGVSSWSLTKDSIINAALRKLGVIAEGATASTNQISTGTEALNSLVKLLAVKGMPLWAITEFTFPTVVGVNTYTIGMGQTLSTITPLKVVQAYRVQTNGATNVPMDIKTHYDFNLLPINSAQAVPVSLFYQPFNTTGIIKLWPTPSDSTTTITIVYQRPFYDIVNSTDNVDFPTYWTDAIIYHLAWRLAPEYGADVQSRNSLAAEAKLFEEEALSFGTEEGSIYLMPDWTGKK